jgi:hypothetical protein
MNYKEHKHPNRLLHIFIIEGIHIDKKITLLNITQALLHFYVKHGFIESHNFENHYIGKIAININDTTIHPILAIPIDKNLDQLTNLSDEKRDVLIKKI